MNFKRSYSNIDISWNKPNKNGQNQDHAHHNHGHHLPMITMAGFLES